MSSTKLRTVLLGKDKPVSRQGLLHLLERGVNVVAVVAPITEAGEPAGILGREAAEHDIPVRSIEDVTKSVTDGSLDIDLAVSLLYWKKIGPDLITSPRYGCINFHPAPLPDFRGVAGYSFAILEQITEWGVSAHFIDENIDTGDLIEVRRFPVDPSEETARSLEKRTRPVLLQLFEDVMAVFIAHQIPPRSKQSSAGRYYSFADLERARQIAPDDGPEMIERKTRAFWYPPHAGASVRLGGREFTLVASHVLNEVAEIYERAEGSLNEGGELGRVRDTE